MPGALPLVAIVCGRGPSGPDGPRVHLGIAADYVQAIERQGLMAAALPPQRNVRGVVDVLGGIILCGGTDVDPHLYGQEPGPHLMPPDPPRDEFEMELVRYALEHSLPILGICRGMQILNVAFGGTLLQDIPASGRYGEVHGPPPGSGEAVAYHTVTVAPDSLLAATVRARRMTVNSAHHQCVERVGSGLRASAHAPDGLIEAVEAEDGRWVLGVQWHPEMMCTSDPVQRAIFSAFADAVRRRVAAHGSTRGKVGAG